MRQLCHFKKQHRPELALQLPELLVLLLDPLLVPALRLLQQNVVRQLHVAGVQAGRPLVLAHDGGELLETEQN